MNTMPHLPRDCVVKVELAYHGRQYYRAIWASVLVMVRFSYLSST
jgi:hypothetical protein